MLEYLCFFTYITNSNDPRGGHPKKRPKQQGLSLKHVFPSIRWMSAKNIKVWHTSKGGSVSNDHAFKLADGPDMYLPMPDRSELRKCIYGHRVLCYSGVGGVVGGV